MVLGTKHTHSDQHRIGRTSAIRLAAHSDWHWHTYRKTHSRCAGKTGYIVADSLPGEQGTAEDNG